MICLHTYLCQLEAIIDLIHKAVYIRFAYLVLFKQFLLPILFSPTRSFFHWLYACMHMFIFKQLPVFVSPWDTELKRRVDKRTTENSRDNGINIEDMAKILYPLQHLCGGNRPEAAASAYGVAYLYALFRAAGRLGVRLPVRRRLIDLPLLRFTFSCRSYPV